MVLSSLNTGHLSPFAGAKTHCPALLADDGHGSNPYPQHPSSFSYWFFTGSANGYVVSGVAAHSQLTPAATVSHTHLPVNSEQYPRPPHVVAGSHRNAHRLSPTPTYPSSHTQSSKSASQSPCAWQASTRGLRVWHNVPVCVSGHEQSPRAVHSPPFWHLHVEQSPPAAASASPPYPGGHWRPYRYAQPPAHSTHGPPSYEPETHRPVAPHHPHPGALMHGSRSPMAPHRASHAGNGCSGSRGVRCGVVCSGHADVSNRDMHCGFRAGFIDRASHHAHPYSLKHSPITARCLKRRLERQRGLKRRLGAEKSVVFFCFFSFSKR